MRQPIPAAPRSPTARSARRSRARPPVRLPVNRRAPQRRGPNQSMLVFAAVLAVIVLAAVLVLVLVSRHNRAPKDDPAAQVTPTAQITEQDTVLAEAKHLAAQYDYDKAIVTVTALPGGRTHRSCSRPRPISRRRRRRPSAGPTRRPFRTSFSTRSSPTLPAPLTATPSRAATTSS